MKYRTFGKTGLEVSALGFGCMRFPIKGQDTSRIDEEHAAAMIREALDKGVNYFDTAWPYHTRDFSQGGNSEPFVGRVLNSVPRDSFFMATKLPSWHIRTREDMDKYLDEQLRRLDTDHIDFYMLHGLSRKLWGPLVKHGAFEFLDAALQSGKIRFAGFSFHDDSALFKEIVDAYDWTFGQIQYNYFDEDFQAGREGLEYAAARGLAVVVMEPLRGGSLAGRLPVEAEQGLRKHHPDRSNVEWALRWVWKHPEVSVVLSGMSHLDHVKENLALADGASEAPWTAEDEAAIAEARRIITRLQKVSCTGCGYCMPCPEGVDIPGNFALANDHHMFQDPAAVNRYQMFMTDKEKASNCTKCGRCEEQCPQQIPIREQLKDVVKMFES